MRFLLTNDDGIFAPGLAALTDAARLVGDCVTVAPAHHASGCGHQVTGHSPLLLKQHADDSFALEGWPADCTRVALRGLHLDVDWVLSGINAGGNLGADVFISGTVAAAREAAYLGKPAVAFSQYKKREMDFDWPRSARWATMVLRTLLGVPCPAGSFWSVNFPHLAADEPDPEVVFCDLDTSPMPVEYRREGDAFVYCGDYHARPRQIGGDVGACMSGRIAVCRLTTG